MPKKDKNLLTSYLCTLLSTDINLIMWDPLKNSK